MWGVAEYFASAGDYMDPQNCSVAAIADDPAFVADLANALVTDQNFMDAITANPQFVSALLASSGFVTNIANNPSFVQAMVDNGDLGTRVINNEVFMSIIAHKIFSSEDGRLFFKDAQDATSLQAFASYFETNGSAISEILGNLMIEFALVGDDGVVVTKADETTLSGGVIEYSFDPVVADGNPLTTLRIGFSAGEATS